MPESRANIRIPEDLAVEIDKLMQRIDLWRSRAEFIQDAVRRQLREYGSGRV